MACKFFTLLHKNARFWSFLATFCLKINRRSATFIRYLRVCTNILTWYLNKHSKNYYNYWFLHSLGCQSQKLREDGISCWCVECPDCECNISENNFLGFENFNYEADCLRNCIDTPECKYYTWYGRDNSQFQNQCFLFSSCESTSQCKGCYRGARKCAEI